ncbi:MAG TPA: IS110 family transposase [Candidatus Binatia bacterium]|nr:IS110 family transposase [Candidatus Binatia bacterium]
MSEPELGIDVAKKKFDVLLMLDDKTLKKIFDNTPKGFKLLQGWLAGLKIERVHACLEATGPYSEPLAEFLFEHGHRVAMVNPFRIRSFANSDLKRNKTDPADARTIAEFCRAKKDRLQDWHPLPPEIKELRELSRRHNVLEKLLGSEKNRRESVRGTKVRSSIDRVITDLEKEIKCVEKLIKEHIKNNPDLKQQSDLLRTIPGIGEKTAHLLLAEIEFCNFDSARDVAAYAGVNPSKSDSGTSKKSTRLSKLGSGRIRKALFFPAIVAKKHNQIVNSFARRLGENGKTKMQVIGACMHKLLHIAFGVLKNHRPFEPNPASYA